MLEGRTGQLSVRPNHYSRAISMAFMLLGFCAVEAGNARKPPGEAQGIRILRWIERPNSHGPSTGAAPADKVEFTKCLTYNTDKKSTASFLVAREQLREGDVIAYKMKRAAARRAVLTGRLNALGYDLLKYGHLAMVVKDQKKADHLLLFSSESFIGPNTRETVDTLAQHDWDAYRLTKWDRVDKQRLYEFIRLVEKHAGHWYGYDFSGMFGLWNSELEPKKPKDIGHDYICSTIVQAALYYSGVELDAVRNKGYLDVCTPQQVISSKGVIRTAPALKLVVTTEPK
jgi:hypothetical protein